MLYLRTASGAFINAANIVLLSPERDDGAEEITSWVATCADGETVTLAPYYAAPGRLEKLMDFIPEVDGAAIGERAGRLASERVRHPLNEQGPRKRPFGCSVRKIKENPVPPGQDRV